MRLGSSIGMILFFSAVMGLAQQSIDSLENVLQATPPGRDRVDQLNNLVSLLRERNNNKAMGFGKEALTLSESIDYRTGYALALENLGWIYYRQGTYAEAFELSRKALKIFEEQDDQVAIARCLNNVAAISYESGKYDEAIENFTKAYRLSSGNLDFATAVRSLNNISYSYLAQANLDSAERFARLALSESVIHRFGYMSAFSFRTLGDIALQRGEASKAMEYFNSSLRISNETNNYFIKTSTLHRIAKAYFFEKQYNEALDVLNQNLIIAEKNGYADELERTYKLISEIYDAKNEPSLAFQHQAKYLELHDSLTFQRYNDRIALLQSQFELDLKEAQIELLTKNVLIQEEEMKHQRMWTYFYVGCLTLVLILILVLYFSYVRIKKTKKELSNINAAKDKLLSVISHDIRSPLASLKGMLSIAGSGNLTQDEFVLLSKKIGSYLDSVYDDVGTVLQWAKLQLQGMLVEPKVFELKPLVDEVIELFIESAHVKDITIRNDVRLNVIVEADPNHVRIALRNLIANAIKFSSRKGEVRITDQHNRPLVNVEVTDKGIGVSEEDMEKLFNPSAHFTRPGTANEKGMGVGLLLTKEFIEKNGGSMAVESELGKGSKFSFTLRKPN
jgi:signal transduction histidine kinase